MERLRKASREAAAARDRNKELLDEGKGKRERGKRWERVEEKEETGRKEEEVETGRGRRVKVKGEGEGGRKEVEGKGEGGKKERGKGRGNGEGKSEKSLFYVFFLELHFFENFFLSFLSVFL